MKTWAGRLGEARSKGEPFRQVRQRQRRRHDRETHRGGERPTGRGAIGVAGIEVDDKDDEVIGMICVGKDDKSKTVLVVSEKGFGKRTQVEEYRAPESF